MHVFAYLFRVSLFSFIYDILFPLILTLPFVSSPLYSSVIPYSPSSCPFISTLLASNATRTMRSCPCLLSYCTCFISNFTFLSLASYLSSILLYQMCSYKGFCMYLRLLYSASNSSVPPSSSCVCAVALCVDIVSSLHSPFSTFAFVSARYDVVPSPSGLKFIHS